ncbi:MAG: hypothetical protein WKG00_35380 [Polyangiaceae bacterium]
MRAGATGTGPGAVALPRAEHVVAEAWLVYAAGAGAKDGGSFRQDGLATLLAAPHLRRWRPGEALAPGMDGLAFHGHTEGQIVPVIRARDDGPPLAVPTDLVPTRSHLRPGWGMAYDNDPRRVVDDKRAGGDAGCSARRSSRPRPAGRGEDKARQGRLRAGARCARQHLKTSELGRHGAVLRGRPMADGCLGGTGPRWPTRVWAQRPTSRRGRAAAVRGAP